MAEIVLTGVKHSRSYKVNDDDMHVDIEHVTTCSDGQQVHMKYTLDMSELTGDEILLHAAKNCNIAWIRKGLFRECTAAQVMDMNGLTVDAAEWRPSKKAHKVADPFDAIRKMVKSGEITAEQAFEKMNTGL